MKEDRERLERMIRRIQGQVGGIGKMINEEKNCESILTQITAAVSSLKTVAYQLMGEEAMSCGKTVEDKEKYVKLLKRYF
jgi:CsoR family transcriptional regulator, copper-sensing transcriptional repressor